MIIKYLFQTRNKSGKRKICILAVLIILVMSVSLIMIRNAVSKEKNTAFLEDGNYIADEFTWSGGSGRVNITCDSITVENGQAYAAVIFDSTYYTSVKIGDKVYDGTHTDEFSIFTIPVTLNDANTIYAVTSKMSAEHEIEYTICPYLSSLGLPVNADTDINADTGKAHGLENAGIISNIPPDINGIKFESKLEKNYAEGFDIFNYSNGYSLINIYGSCRYLVVPEGKTVPQGLDDDIVILKQPIENIYMAATSAMALFRAIGSLDRIRLTGTKESGWYVEEASEALRSGSMLFAGRYSQPDYELLIKEDCGLAIESTMILHAPKVLEMIESIGIPVFIDRSSYEKHPLGRTEWIKLYGILMGKEQEAESFFNSQTEAVYNFLNMENTEKTIAFFYVDGNGNVIVRKSDDYIPKMIELAGGRYISIDVKENMTNSATISLSMEKFYATAVSADYLVYNGTIDNPLGSIKDLIEKDELFGNFKAVKEGNVWTVGKDLYQSTDIAGQLICDLHNMLMEDTSNDMVFLEKVQ